MNLLDLDARWRRFHDADRACPCCGQTFSGIFDIGFDHPDGWPHDARADSGQDVLQIGADKLSADLCRWDDHRFIRCTLPLPIRGSDEVFHFGVWASVHPDRFDDYVNAWQSDDWSGFPGCFAWLMNALPGFDVDDPIAGDLRPGDDGQRPTLHAHDGPLAKAQEDGISFDDLLDIYDATGNDIRPHLADG